MQRMTRQRAAVSELLEQVEDFRSAQQLHELLRERGDAVGLATVYRTMQALADAGEVDVLRSDDGESIYRRCARRTHHHHLVCRVCGRAVEIDAAAVERWARLMGEEYGFTEVDHTAELVGTCAECSRAASAPARAKVSAQP
ncbi:ferric uptake regulator, Fur family [Beutenbergia cavernae DSM 12333]|uniref:Ferric uptake regulator, Fur family n=1 Tax=Beutenbergia cavernae (strain ATCC BAA-8 / DSM 12333 / CCUG 43141 / JCM 11478 / NBRC 16432 / NCIMB 13614 / HKI 0122) TaxID=471853 RepID=C5C4Q0_BEUC1|nr:Fur family transcriptional regulator [Beutenbergia cavernae]ACQ80028.1 ferric uptake regulator, Fur family [Beutenbergia cavernae DSM 12333]